MLLTHNPNRKEKNSSEQSEIKRNDAFRTAYVKTKTENEPKKNNKSRWVECVQFIAGSTSSVAMKCVYEHEKKYHVETVVVKI